MSNLQQIKIDTCDFDEIRQGNCLYVDKTQFIVKLFKKERRVFIARPRRFGKSLMLSVMENLYLGHKNLFKGLAIENHLEEPLFQPHPVISLDMSLVPIVCGIDVLTWRVSP